MLSGFKDKRILACCIIVAEALVLLISGMVYGRRGDIELSYSQDDLQYNNGEPGFYLDKSSEYSYISTPDITLPKGLYTLYAEYECQRGDIGAKIDIQYVDGEYDKDVSGFISISDSTAVRCDFRVKYGGRPLIVRGRLTGDASEGDYILIRNITVASSPLAVRNFVFNLAALFLIADIIVFLYLMFSGRISVGREKRRIDEETFFIIKALIVLIIISSIPLMVDFLWTNAADLKFHLTRIEGLRQGLQNGTFPVKIQPYWLKGHGYAVSVFYGDILLYIPAFLRLFGVSIQAAYQFYVLVINAATVLIAYYCFSHMGGRKNGLICTVLYTLNIFRLYDLYSRAAVGEYTAIVFMPLVLYGLWRIYMLPEESVEHERSYIVLTIGCTGIFLSHMISTEMTAFFAVIALLIFWKKTFRKKNLIVLLKAAAATVLLNLWFLAPFLDYMFSGTYVINNLDSYVEYKLEEKGGFLAQLFMNDYSVIAATRKAALGTNSDMPRSVGAALMAVLAIWFIFCAGKKESGKESKKEERFAVFACALSLLMTTTLFPYTRIAAMIPFLKMPVKSIQYSWRFLVVSGLFLAYLLCIILRKDNISGNKKRIISTALAAILIAYIRQAVLILLT